MGRRRNVFSTKLLLRLEKWAAANAIEPIHGFDPDLAHFTDAYMMLMPDQGSVVARLVYGNKCEKVEWPEDRERYCRFGECMYVELHRHRVEEWPEDEL